MPMSMIAIPNLKKKTIERIFIINVFITLTFYKKSSEILIQSHFIEIQQSGTLNKLK